MTAADRVRALIDAVGEVDEGSRAGAVARWDALAKPPGSLGRVEDVGARLAAMAGEEVPPVPASPGLIVCAADHGVHAQGVTPWPQAITTAMVEVIADGKASCSALARTVGASVVTLDVGCAVEPRPREGLTSARVAAGTADLSVGPAMTADEVVLAVLAGATAAGQMLDDGVDLLVLGDMGLSNTTASAALIAAFTGASAEEVTGAGAGADADTLALKQSIVTGAVRRLPSGAAPLEVLAAVGGLEHAALVGAILVAAGRRVPVLLDGVITDAAALCAAALAPACVGYMIAGHLSTEPGAGVALRHLELDALLDLDLRLGEGTGALLAVPIVQAAARALAETALISELTPG
ncbi:MAG: nicotinate-nucleotide--dimethylbenzimidazole phosphoribosyltransferase [Actinomycetota bacterium]